MVTWVVILVALGLLGSLFWLLPSQAERRRMRLRTQAIQSGLRVREARDKMQEWRLDVADHGMLMRYSLIRPELKSVHWRFAMDDQVRGLMGENIPEPSILPPESLRSIVLAWEAEGAQLAFYWYEQGDQDDLDKAIAYIKSVAESQQRQP